MMKNIASEIKRRIINKEMNMDNVNKGKVWIFFNCDEDKSWATMNPSYNNVIYRKREGRRLLWRKIKADYENNKIQISVDKMSEIRNDILAGRPTDANKYIKYGFIAEMLENQEA